MGGEEGEWRVTSNQNGISFQADENLMELVVMLA